MDEKIMTTLRTGTEKELRGLKMPWPETTEELQEIVTALTERQHDYGTCCYAMSIAAEATFNFVAGKLGVTGFQASCADMDVLRRTRHYEHGFAVLNYGDLLYPQYRDKFDNLSWEDMLASQSKWLREEAGKLLDKTPDAHPHVRDHWERLASAPITLEEGGK